MGKIKQVVEKLKAEEYMGTDKGENFENALKKLYDFVIEKNITKNNLF